MRTSDAINEVAAALAEAQGVMKPAAKDAVNPAYKSKYADLAAVWEACRAALPQFGLAVVQDVTNLDGDVAVTTRITHKSGQWIETGPLLVPMARPDAHGLGSAMTYGKRYALSAAVGIAAEEDDDGNAAAGNRTTKRERDDATADAAIERMGIRSGPVDLPFAGSDATDAGLIGIAQVGKGTVDFELRQTPTGHKLEFRLVEGRKGIRVVALDALAEQIAEHRTGIEGYRVTCWGRLTDQTFTPKPKDENDHPRPVTYQVLSLTRLKVGPMTLDGVSLLADLAAPAEAESVELFPVPA